jgi:outer membrane protein assembly factor BamA
VALWLGSWAGVSHAAEAASTLEADRYEPVIIPAFSGDTDVGVKVGAFGQLARYKDDARPYAWRVQAYGAISVFDGADGIEFPFRNAFLKLDWPRTFGTRLRMLTEISYLQTTNFGYYGLGNAAPARPLWEDYSARTAEYVAARRKYQFDGTTMTSRAQAMLPIGPGWQTYGGARIDLMLFDFYAGSRLSQDIANGPGAGERLYGVTDHTAIVGNYGVVFDTRNHETVPTSGQHHDLGFRVNPGAFGSDAYLGATLTLRTFWAAWGEKLTVGMRALGDVLTSRAPLSELGQYGGLYRGYGPAGSRGIRGVPQGRLIGRTKMIANLELQSLLLHFDFLGQKFTLGPAAFADVGRVWTGTLQSNPALDGRNPGIHWGVGGGPRLRWGDAMLLRFDFAFAPLGVAMRDVPAVYVEVDQVY